MMKSFESLFNSRLDVWCNRAKKLLKLLAMSIGLVINSTLLLTIVFGDSDSLILSEIIDLIHFHVFFILLILFFK